MHTRGPDHRPLRDHIAQIAGQLFYKDGIHLVGVDRVASEASVTKRTLYRHFHSKDELIAAALRAAPRAIFPEEGSPREQLLGAFDALEAFLTNSQYRGCPYIIFTAELTERGHPARALIESLLAKRREWFRERCAAAGALDPSGLAEQLDVVFDGAAASGAKRSDVRPVKAAAQVARVLLDAALQPQRDQKPARSTRSKNA